MGRELSASEVTVNSRAFTRSLLADIHALERMLQEGRFETGIRRIGAEQELFLVNRGWRAAPVGPEILAELEGEEFTTEIGRFNLEVNLPPLELDGSVFSRLQDDLQRLMGRVREAASAHEAEVVLTGILPTLGVSDLQLEHMTPRERYRILNRTLNRMAGGSYRLYIQGTDELHFVHDSVMLEACNTSFQVHLQVAPREFPRYYNVAQVMTAPVLAAAANSPLLFGRRLWRETRIALFQQSLDTRRSTPHLRELTPRVRFGEDWVHDSVLEVFREDVARIPVLFGESSSEDPVEVLRQGGVPELRALQLYNSTVYRWNRPCYGILDGEPHLRIECRVLPAGPSLADEVANGAFWIGLVLGGAHRYDDVRELIDFAEARANFLAAARNGMGAGFNWFGGTMVSAAELIRGELVALAREGLEMAGVDGADADRYLGIIRERVSRQATGARWLLRSLAAMKGKGIRGERLAAVTSATAARQWDGDPCHEWELADLEEAGGWRYNYARVEQIMTTDLYTVKEDELVDLAALVMHWNRVRQIPVEDEDRHLVGLLSYDAVLRELTSGNGRWESDGSAVYELMDRDPVTVTPDTSTLDAITMMRREGVVSCPVVEDGRLVGILSVGDFGPIAERYLEEKLNVGDSEARAADGEGASE